MPSPTTSLDDLLAELRAIRSQLGVKEPGLLLDAEQSAAFSGLSMSALYRMAADGTLIPVDVPGVGRRWRRADLEKWAARLKPGRRRAKVDTAD